MSALDTSVLVRFLVGDDPKQASKAKSLVGRLDENEARAFVSDIVLCELVWVLASHYRFGRSQIAVAVRKLLAARQLRFESTDNLLRAISAYETSQGDFADYLIREHARAAGCEAVLTFDQALHEDGSFAAP